MKKRLISMFLVLVMALGMLPTTALAASSTIGGALGEVNITNGGYKMSYLSMNGVVRSQSYTYFNFKSASGAIKEIPAYCINPTTKGVPQSVSPGTSIKYIANEASNDPKIVGIIANGYPHRGLSELKLDNKYQAYYATKMALWCYLIDGWSIDRLTVNPSLSGVEKERGEKLLAAAKDIYKRGIWWNRVPQPTITVTADKDSAYPVTIDGKEYLQQVFTADSETWVCDYDIDIGFTMPDEVPEGTRIVDMNNNDITKIRTSPNGASYAGQFKVLYPKDSVSDQTGSVQMSLHANVYKYAIYYALCAETSKYGTLQRYMCDTDPTTEIRQSTFSRYSSTPSDTPDEPETSTETTLIIKKVETGTNTPLSGATFEVKAPDGTVLGSFVTDTSGKIIIPLTLSGQYVITEKAAPRWHLLGTETTKTVSVDYGNTATVTFENAPYGDLRIEKIDASTGASLAGAKIQIKHIESGAPYTGTTGTGGSYTFTELKPGAYEIRELSAPEGWERDSQTYTTTVVAGDCVTYTLKNEALPGLKIIKYDRESHETMPGVTFRIWRDGELLGDYETDALGEILLTDCRPGTYRVQEVDTGDSGHLADSTPQEIELKAGDSIKELYFFNDQKPGIWLVKVDSANPSKVIPNAKFRIEAVDGSFGPAEFVTDQNGEIDLSELPTGAYVVTELDCPGYIIDEAQRIIQLEANQTARFVFTNSVQPSLHLIKLSADGSRLAGVTFRIAKIEDGSRYLDRTTDENGEILISGLEPGVYSVKELDTTSDHISDPVERHVELFPGKTSTIILENDIRPNLTVVKRDADTGEPVPDTVFLVEAADGHSVDEIKTGADGTASLENLLPGVYQISEKSVPSPYLMDAEPQLVTLYPNRNHTVYFENHKKPTLTIQKVDSITGSPIQGAKFQVWYGSNGTDTGELNDLGTYFTDASGQIVLEDLRGGWYRVTELEPAPGFTIKEPTTQEFYITSGRDRTVTFQNVPLNAIVVEKYDSVTGEALGGATFQLRYLGGASGTGGTVIGQKVTGSNGMAIWTGLKPGSYIVEEVDPADGYSIIQSSETVYLADSGEQSVITVRFENMPDGNLLIRKVCATNPSETLPDAEFKVTYADGALIGDSNGIFRTDENGEIRIEGLKPGKSVVVTEVTAPPGYMIDTQSQTIQIKEGRTVSLTFKNQPKGELIIQKRDSATGQPLPGAEFRVTTAAGCEVGLDGVIGDSTLTQNGVFTTDSSGEIRITNLAPGAYVLTEIKAPHGYVMDAPSTNVVIGEGVDTQTVVITNTPKGGLVINKLDSVTHEPLEGVEFTITEADGTVVDDNGGMTSSMGLYRTDENGQIIIDGLVGTFIITETKTIEGYTIHEETRTQTVVINPNDTQTITVYNDPIGGVEIIKVNADDTRERIPNTTFEIRRMDDALVDTVTTDKNGRVFLSLENGSYYAVETESAEGFKLDDTPHYFEVKNGETTVLQVENTPVSGILIHKTDSTTGEGIYGVPFILYDSTNTPVGQYTSNNEGYVLIEGLEAGRYYLRELENEGYVPDTEKKTVYVESGETTEVEWENTPITGQIQITKTSADYNSVNGWPAGTPNPGTEFEIYHARTGNLVDTVETDKNGVASSRPLPLGRYKIVESKAADFYGLDKTPIEVEIEFEGQIVKAAMTNKGLYTNVSIQKTGYVEVMPGQQIRYDFSGIGNNSTTSLTSFFWRDTLPGQAVRLDKIVTGTYNVPGNYKVVYKTNLSGGTWRTLADNLSTQQNYVLDASRAALGLASNEYITEFMVSFGVVPANFRQVEAPQVYATVYAWLTGGSQFVNQADVGGVYNGQWIMATSRWVTKVYKPAEPLPRTGY